MKVKNQYLQKIPRTLNNEKIDSAIEEYFSILSKTSINIDSKNVLSLFKQLKRERVKQGPYPGLTVFEVANRVMTDLVILFGVKKLLKQEEDYMIFDEYTIELGNENNQSFDIQAQKENKKLRGEAFNVASSFFQGKKSSALSKLRKNNHNNDTIVILYNSDAPKKGKDYKPVFVENEFHLPVQLDFNI